MISYLINVQLLIDFITDLGNTKHTIIRTQIRTDKR